MATAIDMSHSNHDHEDFSDRDFKGAKLNNSIFHYCKFDRSTLEDANCEFVDFTGSTFQDTNLRCCNMKDAVLAGTLFHPRDCMGITLTLKCDTFRGVRISQLWWMGFLIFASMMVPDKYPITEPLHDKLIAMIGAERYVKLRALFQRREL